MFLDFRVKDQKCGRDKSALVFVARARRPRKMPLFNIEKIFCRIYYLLRTPYSGGSCLNQSEVVQSIFLSGIERITSFSPSLVFYFEDSEQKLFRRVF